MSALPFGLSGRALAAAGAVAAASGLAAANFAKTRKAERRNAIGGSFVDVDGVKLHYLRRGEGPPVVLLHGNGSMIQDWQISGLVDLLAEDHQVIAFDRPGFGYSARPRSTIWTPEAQAELVAEALSPLSIEAPIVVGHSFGALVALALALDHPESVSRVVLLSGYYYPTSRLDAVLAAGPAIPVVGDVMRHTVSPFAGKAMEPFATRKLFAPAEVSQAWKNDYPSEMALRPSQIRATAADAALMIPAAARLSARYGDLELPISIVAGEGDRVIDPVRQSARLHGNQPGSDFTLVPNTGHMVHHSAAAAVHAAIVGTGPVSGRGVQASA